jgi:hypothetical protein
MPVGRDLSVTLGSLQRRVVAAFFLRFGLWAYPFFGSGGYWFRFYSESLGNVWSAHLLQPHWLFSVKLACANVSGLIVSVAVTTLGPR